MSTLRVAGRFRASLQEALLAKIHFGLPPYYYKNIDDDGLFAWYDALIAATRDQPIPIYLYNFPQMTGIVLSSELVARLLAAHPRRITGLKDSSGNLNYARELAEFDRFDVFPSSETTLGDREKHGYAGCISATVNLTAPMAYALWQDNSQSGIQDEIARARAGIATEPLISAVKFLTGVVHDDETFSAVSLRYGSSCASRWAGERTDRQSQARLHKARDAVAEAIPD